MFYIVNILNLYLQTNLQPFNVYSLSIHPRRVDTLKREDSVDTRVIGFESTITVIFCNRVFCNLFI